MSDRTPPRRGLGRGLGSLIPTGPTPAHASGEEADGDGRGHGGGHQERTGTAPPATAATLTETRPLSGPTEESVPADWIGRLPGQPQPGARPGPPPGSEPSAVGVTGDPALQPVHGAYFAELPVATISPNPRQPRQVFDEEAMAELVHSIREVGLLQPVVVRRAGDTTYELVMGERRWRATQAAGLDTIPAIVRETGDDALLRDALLENLHRAQLNALEEAAAYQQLLDDFGCTHEELAARIGRSRPQISNTIRLLRLSPPVQRRVAAGVLSAGHARTLLAIEDEATQDHVAGRVVAEGISVRGLEELVALGDLSSEPPRTPRPARPSSPALDDLASRLSDLYDTRVKVDLGRTKGKISIEFASVPDLERIVAAMDPTYERRQSPAHS